MYHWTYLTNPKCYKARGCIFLQCHGMDGGVAFLTKIYFLKGLDLDWADSLESNVCFSFWTEALNKSSSAKRTPQSKCYYSNRTVKSTSTYSLCPCKNKLCLSYCPTYCVCLRKHLNISNCGMSSSLYLTVRTISSICSSKWERPPHPAGNRQRSEETCKTAHAKDAQYQSQHSFNPLKQQCENERYFRDTYA